jgi:hypothetical protein
VLSRTSVSHIELHLSEPHLSVTLFATTPQKGHAESAFCGNCYRWWHCFVSGAFLIAEQIGVG